MSKVAGRQRSLCQAFDQYKSSEAERSAAKERLDDCIRELIRITIEDLEQRSDNDEDQDKPCFFKKFQTLVAGLYYLSPFAKLTHPAKHKLAWKVLNEFQQYRLEQCSKQQQTTDTV